MKATQRSGKKGKYWVARGPYCDETGQLHDWSAMGRTKTEAEANLQHKFESSGIGTADSLVNGNMTIEALWNFWLAEVELNGEYAISTLTGYKVLWRNHTKNRLGNLKVGQVSVATIDSHIKMLQTSVSHDNARKVRGLLRMVFDVAVRHDVRPTNPVAGTASPSKAKSDRREIDVIPLIDVPAFRRALRAEDARVKPGPRSPNPLDDVASLLFAGLRIGEALALRWQDVDLAAGPDGTRVTVTICGTLTEETGRGLLRNDEPKTPAGFRTLLLTIAVGEMLKIRKANLKSNNLNNSVFVTSRGAWVSPNNFRRSLNRVLNQTSFTATPHTLRRTFATEADRHRGARSDTDLALAMGHSSPEITRGSYIRPATVAPDYSDVGQLFE